MGIEPTQDASQRPANGFEDRGARVRRLLSAFASVRSLVSGVRDCPPLSALVHRLGCQLGCQRTSWARYETLAFRVARSYVVNSRSAGEIEIS